MCLAMNNSNGFFRTPLRLSRRRIAAVLVIAAVSDALQVLTQTTVVVPAMIDVVAMVLTTAVLGFHPLLLPTFVIELFPIVDALPTWTGCVAVVIALRKRSEPIEVSVSAPPPVTPAEPPLLPPPSTPPRQ